MNILTLLLPVLFVAVLWDFYKGKIPNILILSAAVAGVIHLNCNYGMEAVLFHIPGILLPLILLFPLYKIGTLGAGDIKLFSLLGIYFSFMETVVCIFTAFIIGAMISFIALLWRRNLRERMVYFVDFLKDCISCGRFRYYYLESEKEKSAKEKSKIHFSLPIFLSIIFLLIMQKSKSF